MRMLRFAEFEMLSPVLSKVEDMEYSATSAVMRYRNRTSRRR